MIHRKRLEAVTRSPVFAWFQESLSGLDTARAYGLSSVFRSINEQRSDNNLECYLPSINTNRLVEISRGSHCPRLTRVVS